MSERNTGNNGAEKMEKMEKIKREAMEKRKLETTKKSPTNATIVAFQHSLGLIYGYT